ncbi:arylsulfatase [Fulvivirgaceae bacterium BMA12]|uniref:Arylsulfatase n=1 Tax=Agaribacillus aureus TaxID=3051825 RepID=A0ABT8L655_9BACT|nr:arylsulfatase [Fulvivirgaceae bacterium BMA12]
MTCYLFSMGCAYEETRFRSDLPNIVFIMADDMGYGDPLCYNADSRIPTPNIDRLAREGIMYTDAHAPSGVCTPTRYGVLTGRYCWRTRLKSKSLRSNDALLIDTTRSTVADLLQQNGYYTGLIGKWHLGLGSTKPTDYTKALTPGPLALGFDYFFGIPASLNMLPTCFIENEHPKAQYQIGRPDSLFREYSSTLPAWEYSRVGPAVTMQAVHFIHEHVQQRAGQPFYLHLVPSAPHRPCLPPDFIKGRSQAGERGDMVAEFDWTVGEILKTLDSLSLSEKTIVVVTSDNGAIPGDQISRDGNLSSNWNMYGHASCGPWRGYKTHIYEGGHRVPLIVRWPDKINAAQRSKQLISLTDWFATIAHILGRPLSPDEGEDSFSFAHTFNDHFETVQVRDHMVHHSQYGMFAIRSGDWKYIAGSGSGGETDRESDLPKGVAAGGQLYNLVDDPGEKLNRLPEQTEISRKLKTVLADIKNGTTSRN